MKGLRARRVRIVKGGTLIATVDIGITNNTGYCTTLDGRSTKCFSFDNSKEGRGGIFMDIRHILMQLEAEVRFISEREAEMRATLERIPDSVRLLSIKGLGTVSVAGVIGEVGEFSKFSTQSEITKLAGLDLYEISSGKRKGQRRISKRGRSLLRKILSYAAIQMIRRNGSMYDYFEALKRPPTSEYMTPRQHPNPN